MVGSSGQGWASFGDLAEWAAIVASFIWSYLNWRQANHNRKRSALLEEFRRLKTPIEVTLANLSEEMSVVLNYPNSTITIDKIRSEVDELNKKAVSLVLRLQRELGQLDTSELVNGRDWAKSIDDKYDSLLSTFDKITNKNRTEQEIRQCVTEISKKADSIVLLIRSRFDKETSMLI